MWELSSLSFWRLSRWIIAIGSLLSVAVYIGLIPPPHDVLSWLANRSDAPATFHDPNFDRADALVLLFGAVLLGPLAAMLILMCLVFLMAILGGFVLPVVNWLRLPDWVANVIVVATVGALAYVGRDLWMPRSLWFLSVLARACRIILA